MNTIVTLAFAAAFVSLTACEGEPPKVPTNSPPAPEAQPIAATAAQPAPSAAPPLAQPAPSAAAPASTCPGCPCAGGGQPVPAGSAEAPNPAPTATAPAQTPVAAPAAAVHGNVVGMITTVPARSAGSAVVYLEDAPIVPNRGALAGIDNRGMAFLPFVTVLAAGGRVAFMNSDPFPHNVFTPDNERFNLGMLQPKGSASHTFKTPGVYSLLCNLHPNMLGYVVVTPSSYFAKANAKGEFSLKDVPAGTYKITAWAPRQQTVTQSVTINGADVKVEFALHRKE